MSALKPSEVSKILKQQLKEIDTEAQIDEVGSVLQVGDGIARIYGMSNVYANELIEFESGIRGIVLNLEEDNVGAVLLGLSDKVKEGDTVKRTNRIASINVSEGMLGRIINTLGDLIDGKGPILIDMSSQTSYDVAGSSTQYFSICSPSPTGVEDGLLAAGIPQEFALHQSYPNPFNAYTNIQYEIPEASHVSIEIFNIQGQLVRTLIDEKNEQTLNHDSFYMPQLES